MSMVTVNDVYRKIKEISVAEWTPRPTISITTISQELQSSRETLLPLLVKLEDLKLIRFNETAKTTIKLTLLGNNVNRSKL